MTRAMIRRYAVAAFALISTIPVAGAQPVSTDIAARTELHAIHTLTLSDHQFLTGDAEAQATVVSGQLRLPAAAGRLPVVMLMHGSGGMGLTSRRGRASSTPSASPVSRWTASPVAA